MVYDTPTFVVNHLCQSSLYNRTWNTQNTSHLFCNTDPVVNKKNNKITCKRYKRCFFVLNVSNINISDNKVHKFVVVNSVDLKKYNQRFQVYFWIFRLTLACHVSTNQSAPSYSLRIHYFRFVSSHINPISNRQYNNIVFVLQLICNFF